MPYGVDYGDAEKRIATAIADYAKGASVENQIVTNTALGTVITRLESIAAALPLAVELSTITKIATTSGSIAAGAKAVSFVCLSGSSAIATNIPLDSAGLIKEWHFPLLGSGITYDPIPYIVTSGQLLIVESRIITPKILTYASPGDTNGAFYWLGTNEGTTGFSNPYTASKIGFTPTAFDSEFDPRANLFDRDNGTGYAGGKYLAGGDPARFVFDFLTHTLKPNYYTWRTKSGGSDPGDNPVAWSLEGSTDNTTWAVLDTVTGRTPSQWTTDNYWYSKSLVGNVPYRYLRFNYAQSADGNYFRMGEFEFYGLLK